MKRTVHESDFVCDRWCVVERATRRVRWTSNTRKGSRVWAAIANLPNKRGRFAIRRCQVSVAK